jgi:hypothetical protein
MYGNTRAIAEAVGVGLSSAMAVDVLPISAATPVSLRRSDLLVLGGPTHAWGLSRANTRKAAAKGAAKPGSGLTMERGWDGDGLREWLTGMCSVPPTVAAFDTRIKGPFGLSGSAARAIARRLRQRGFVLSTGPAGFFVTKQNRLVDGETARAEQWGRDLAAKAFARAGQPQAR